MKTRFSYFSAVLVVIMLGTAGCNSTASQPTPEAEELPTEISTAVPLPAEIPTAVPEPTVDPDVAIVMSMLERVNAEDYAGAAEFVDEDMMAYLIGMPPTGIEIYRGKERFRSFLEECCTGQHFVWEVTPGKVKDGMVFGEAQTWMDFTRELGVAPNSFHEIFVVKDGKITLYASMMSEEALANFKPALAEVMPDLFKVILPEGETPVSEVYVTIADGTCAYDGPMTLRAGEVTLNVDVQDQAAEKYAVSFFPLDEDRDLVDLMASTHRSSPPAWARMVFLRELKPNESYTHENYVVNEGLLYMVCWSGPPEIAIGNAGPFVIRP